MTNSTPHDNDSLDGAYRDFGRRKRSPRGPRGDGDGSGERDGRPPRRGYRARDDRDDARGGYRGRCPFRGDGERRPFRERRFDDRGPRDGERFSGERERNDGERGGRFFRDRRPPFENRGFHGRPDRPDRRDRPPRGRFRDRDERPYRPERDDRPFRPPRAPRDGFESRGDFDAPRAPRPPRPGRPGRAPRDDAPFTRGELPPGAPKRGGKPPFRAGGKSKPPFGGGPKRGGPKRGGPKRGGPKRGGPKRGGKPGGPFRGGKPGGGGFRPKRPPKRG